MSCSFIWSNKTGIGKFIEKSENLKQSSQKKPPENHLANSVYTSMSFKDIN